MLQGIEIVWEGVSYRLPPRRTMEALAAIEDHITIGHMARCASGQDDLPIVKLAKAYTALLRVMGAVVDEIDVYRHMFDNNNEGVRESMATLNLLMRLMIPPEAIRKAMAQSGNAAPPAETTLGAGGLSEPSKPQSGLAGSDPPSSGSLPH